MNIKIEYESDSLLTPKLEKSILKLEERILRDYLEGDKIICNISTFRGELIQWFADNRK